MKEKIIAFLIVLGIAIVCTGAGIAIAHAIATSDMPEWLKFYFLTR